VLSGVPENLLATYGRTSLTFRRVWKHLEFLKRTGEAYWTVGEDSELLLNLLQICRCWLQSVLSRMDERRVMIIVGKRMVAVVM